MEEIPNLGTKSKYLFGFRYLSHGGGAGGGGGEPVHGVAVVAQQDQRRGARRDGISCQVLWTKQGTWI